MTTPIRTAAGIGAALTALAALSLDSSPTLAQDQGAPCSWGSDSACMYTRTCLETGFKFQLWPFQIGWAECHSWEDRWLYYKPAPEPDDSYPSGSEPEDPGTPPGG